MPQPPDTSSHKTFLNVKRVFEQKTAPQSHSGDLGVPRRLQARIPEFREDPRKGTICYGGGACSHHTILQ